MATAGEVVAAMADTFSVKVSTVEGIDRALSEAGLRVKSGRGNSAAHMAGIDVINLAFAMILEVSMKDAAAKVSKVTRMRSLKALVQWRPDPDLSLSALAEQVEQYQEHTAASADLSGFSAGTALVEAATLGEGLAALVNAMATGQFGASDEMALNVQMSSIGPSAKLAYATRKGVLRIHYETTGPDVERPVFERRLKLDETLLWRLAEMIRPK